MKHGLRLLLSLQGEGNGKASRIFLKGNGVKEQLARHFYGELPPSGAIHLDKPKEGAEQKTLRAKVLSRPRLGAREGPTGYLPVTGQ